MVEWIIIGTLVILGIALIVVEVIFIPGTTIVGLIGFGISAFGIYLSFVNFNTSIGIIVLSLSIIICGAAIFIAFKSGVWKKLSLHTANESKVNQEFKIDLQIEQRGEAISALRPVGKAEFDEKEYEVQTIGGYVDAGTAIKIISIKGRKIFVEPLN